MSEIVSAKEIGLIASASANWMTNTLSIRIRRGTPSEYPNTLTVRYPANWREAIKEQFAPQWFKQRCPVQYDEVVIDMQAIRPIL